MSSLIVFIQYNASDLLLKWTFVHPFLITYSLSRFKRRMIQLDWIDSRTDVCTCDKKEEAENMSWTRGIVAFACTGTLNKMYLKMYLSNCIFRICIFCVYRHIEQDIPAILPNYIIMKTKSVWELFLKIPPHCIDQILINAILINANGNNNIFLWVSQTNNQCCHLCIFFTALSWFLVKYKDSISIV